VVGLSERGAWLPIVQRLALDLAIAVCLSWLERRALLLGAIAGGMSALLACAGYAPKNRDFTLKDGLWWLGKSCRRAQPHAEAQEVPRYCRQRGQGPARNALTRGGLALTREGSASPPSAAPPNCLPTRHEGTVLNLSE
jgi:hypothetical protein